MDVQETIDPAMVVLTCYPNPATDDLTVQYYLKESSGISIKITDLNGRVLYSGISKEMPRGINNSIINIADLATGSTF